MGLTGRARNEIIVSSVMFTLASIALVLRYLATMMMRKGLNLSDVFAGLSWLVLLVLVILIILWAAIGGNGEQVTSLEPHQLGLFYKFFYGVELTYVVLAPSIKLFMVSYYRSVFPIRTFRLAADILATIFAVWGIAVLLAAVFQCRPIRAFWDPSSGRCFDQIAFLYAFLSLNIFFDFILLVMPSFVIWRIQRPLKDRLALLAVFSLGGLGCVSSIVRIVALRRVERIDITYTIYHSTIWTLVEPCIALICGSLPVFYGYVRLRRNQSSTKLETNSPVSSQGRQRNPKHVRTVDEKEQGETPVGLFVLSKSLAARIKRTMTPASSP